MSPHYFQLLTYFYLLWISYVSKLTCLKPNSWLSQLPDSSVLYISANSNSILPATRARSPDVIPTHLHPVHGQMYLKFDLHCYCLIPKHPNLLLAYCNSLTPDIRVSTIDTLPQPILNTTASAILLKHKPDDITPPLTILPYLPSCKDKAKSL